MYCLQIKWKEEEEDEDGEKCGSPQRIKCMAHPKEKKWILGTSIKVYTVLCFRFSFFLSSILISMFTSWEINLPSVFRSSWQQCYIKTFLCSMFVLFRPSVALSLLFPQKQESLSLTPVYITCSLSIYCRSSIIHRELRKFCDWIVPLELTQYKSIPVGCIQTMNWMLTFENNQVIIFLISEMEKLLY